MKNDNILIFRTSLDKRRDVKRIAEILDNYPGIKCWNVDLEDWEKVLRIECDGMCHDDISNILRTVNVWAVELQ